MLAAVEFNDQSSIERSEVANVEADLVLTAELEAANLSAPQAAPEQAFRAGLIMAKSAHMAKHVRIEPRQLGYNVIMYTTMESGS